jgi:hypothetical protein
MTKGALGCDSLGELQKLIVYGLAALICRFGTQSNDRTRRRNPR